jgi:hypothetical protein
VRGEVEMEAHTTGRSLSFIEEGFDWFFDAFW